MPYQERSVISADGTILGFRHYGDGPALILIHGNLQATQSFDKLAEALSGSFTVCVPDRRGRGLSGPHGVDHSVERECEDIAALAAATSARQLFGGDAGRR